MIQRGWLGWRTWNCTLLDQGCEEEKESPYLSVVKNYNKQDQAVMIN
jgi:hypothetical protein